MNKNYHIFGLKIRSSISLPASIIPDFSPDAPPDVIIEYGDTPEHLSHPQSKSTNHEASPGEFLLSLPWLGRFYIQEGRRITITRHPEASEEWILVYLMGSVIGALLHQRNYLVLHAGAIRTNDFSAIFLGPSGIGKSTLAAGFHQREYPFLADDVCAVSLINGKPFVIPGFLQLKLWDDALRKLGKDKDQFKSVLWKKDLEKYFMPVEQAEEHPVPLKTVFELKAQNADHPAITMLTGAAKIDSFIKNTYRLGFLHGLGGKAEHFRHCAAVAAQTNVYQVERPQNSFLLDELMDMMETKFS
jgi:hypothetical protein